MPDNVPDEYSLSVSTRCVWQYYQGAPKVRLTLDDRDTDFLAFSLAASPLTLDDMILRKRRQRVHWLVVAEARKWHECDVHACARCARGATAARGARGAGKGELRRQASQRMLTGARQVVFYANALRAPPTAF